VRLRVRCGASDGKRLAHRPHGGRDGSDDRHLDRSAHDLRHGQGARQRHGDRRRAPAREDRRQERPLARGMTAPLLLEDAQRRLLEATHPLGPGAEPIATCAGRYLWSSLAAKRTQPAADLSAMDGYAVRDPRAGPWRVVGESAAGRPHAGGLEPGEAVRISTGALMPAGAQAVLLQEEAIRDGERLAATADNAASARHIRRRGFDFATGDAVLEAGTRLGPVQLALAITA